MQINADQRMNGNDEWLEAESHESVDKSSNYSWTKPTSRF